MEIILWIGGVVIILAVIGEFTTMLKKSIKSINWAMLLLTLITGSIALAIIFSFTSEGVAIIIGSYILLIIGSLFMGMSQKETHKKKKKMKNKQTNWDFFFTVLIGGGILLSILFSFTSEGALVILGIYTTLVIVALFVSLFKN